MRCGNCKFEENCNLREIAPDLTGCTGYSRERNKLNGEVKCFICGHWVNEKE